MPKTKHRLQPGGKAVPHPGRTGVSVMGAIGIGVLVILLFGSFGQSVRDQQAAATVAPAPPAEAADTTALPPQPSWRMRARYRRALEVRLGHHAALPAPIAGNGLAFGTRSGRCGCASHCCSASWAVLGVGGASGGGGATQLPLPSLPPRPTGGITSDDPIST
jgi:hypothetical protein